MEIQSAITHRARVGDSVLVFDAYNAAVLLSNEQGTEKYSIEVLLDAAPGAFIGKSEAHDKLQEFAQHCMAFVPMLIAETAHEVNRTYCWGHGDTSHAPWADAPDWQKGSAASGVLALMKDPSLTPEQMHGNWMARKLEEGWTHGPTKDAEAKTHPCLVPYDELPPHEQLKDHLFHAVCRTLIDSVP